MISTIFNKISDNSIVSYAKEKTGRLGIKVFELFQAYVAKPVENFAIGDLRNFNQEFTYSEDGSLGIHRFGHLASYAIWTPKSKDELRQVLDQLDKEPNGRSTYRSAQVLIQSSSFLLSDTSSEAYGHRKAFLKLSQPYRYAIAVWEFLENHKQSNLEFSKVAMQVVANELLGIEGELSLNEIIQLEQLGYNFKEYSANPLPLNLLKFTSQFKQRQKFHQNSIEQMLKTQIQCVLKYLEEGGSPTFIKGLLKEEILKKLEMGFDPKKLHQDRDLKSNFLLLIAVDNLSFALKNLDQFLQSDIEGEREVVSAIAAEIGASSVIQEGGKKFDPQVLMIDSKMPLLDALYKRCLVHNASKTPIVMRYAQKSIRCGEHSIPARTYLAILPPIERVENNELLADKMPSSLLPETNTVPTSLFSEGSRMCPGRAIAKAIFKAIVVCYIVNEHSWDSQDRAEAEKIEKSLKDFKNCYHTIDEIDSAIEVCTIFLGMLKLPKRLKNLVFQKIDETFLLKNNIELPPKWDWDKHLDFVEVLKRNLENRWP